MSNATIERSKVPVLPCAAQPGEKCKIMVGDVLVYDVTPPPFSTKSTLGLPMSTPCPLLKGDSTPATVSLAQEYILSEGRGMNRKLLRLKAVKGMVPYSTSTIYLEIGKGNFPRPISMGGRAVAWLESEIDEWIARRVEVRDTGEANRKANS